MVTLPSYTWLQPSASNGLPCTVICASLGSAVTQTSTIGGAIKFPGGGGAKFPGGVRLQPATEIKIPAEAARRGFPRNERRLYSIKFAFLHTGYFVFQRNSISDHQGVAFVDAGADEGAEAGTEVLAAEAGAVADALTIVI